jgi:ACS family hexuronate transporter-like MFS transporter
MCVAIIFALPASADLSRQRRFAWSIAAALFAGSVINYLDRATLGVVMPQIRRDLGLTNQQYGWAVDAFLLAYMISYILGGRLADRFGCRRMVSLTVVFWSVAGMAHALVRGLGSLSLARAMLGFGEAGFYPAAMRGVAGWFPPRDRAKAVGLFLSALSVGTLLTAPLVAWVTLRYGWRASFLVTGGVGFLLLPPWLRLHRRIRAAYGEADPAPAELAESRLAGAVVPLAYVLTTRKYWCTLAARGCTDAAWYFYLFWLPGYFQEVRGLSLAAVGRLLWIPYLTAGIGALAGAWASSELIRRGRGLDRGRKAVLLPSAAIAALGAAACFVPDYRMAVAIVALALFGHQSWSSNIHTAISEISPPAHVAVLYGITGAAGTLMGALAQLVIGPVVDAAGYESVFVGAGLLYVVAAGLLLAAGRIEAIAPKGAVLD